jgi:hypothetical protein
MLGNYSVATQLVGCQVVLYSIELVSQTFDMKQVLGGQLDSQHYN